ncbi:CHRD domain-containing protein [Candidatus Nitrosocosmicus franklandus]|uniref:CHRD domain protein n=1 Tax=Candidatus Nitrosocosmicus franklandianus TaxID=1798806 RepID=A0A484I7B6_9ARCH|nr:CHRD domain-containing protein [Candidatus Nitrosocosmicus franklandus]VFJ13629.1 CHRD domain protein [Candidatus Nitrosocosmicus franklandus]
MKTSNYMMTFMLLSITAAIAGVLVTTISSISTAYANHEFAANLTGLEEVPPVDTQATGHAILVPISPSNQTIQYFVNVTGIQGATQGHIHSGAQGKNGAIIVTLFKFDFPQNTVFEKGNITANNLEGPLQGKTIPDLIAAMKNGSTYVNVHTEQNPEGEVRGQLVDIP